MMVQALKTSYRLHSWYEHVPVRTLNESGDDHAAWILREGPIDLQVIISEKELTFEQDRPKVLFLERQSRLLG